MKKQVLASIIGTVAAFTSTTAHADNWVNPSAYITHNAPARVTCTLTQLNPNGGEPIEKTTLGAFNFDERRKATLEFKGKDSQVLATAVVYDGSDAELIEMNISGVQVYQRWVSIGQTVSANYPIDNMTMDCSVHYAQQQSYDEMMAAMRRRESAHEWHGGSRGGQQWTVGATTMQFTNIKEARYEIVSKAFGDDRVIDFQGGLVIGFQVTSGWGKDSTTNAFWKEENYINTAGGVGTNYLKLRFSNQPVHGMKYSVSVFYF